MLSLNSCKQSWTTTNDTSRTQVWIKMAQYLTWQTHVISSISTSLEPKKTHLNLIHLSISSHRPLASATSLNLALLGKLKMMSKLSISITFQNNPEEKTTNFWCNHSKRKRWFELNIQMSMGLKKERYISILSSQTSLTRASTINHADCIDTKRILKDLCTSRSFKTTWFRRWMRLSGQSIWLRWFMLCGSIHGQQLSKCISHTPQSWFSLQGNSFNILHRSFSQCVK